MTERCPKCGSDRVDQLEWTYRAGTLGLQCRECGYHRLPGEPADPAKRRIEQEIRWLRRQASIEDEFSPPANANSAYRVAADHLETILNGGVPQDWASETGGTHWEDYVDEHGYE